MGRKLKDQKLVEFGKLSEKIQKLGFESIIVIGMEKNDGSGKTFISTKYGKKDKLNNVSSAKFEKAVSYLLFILGCTPEELIRSADSLKLLSEAAQMHSIGVLLQNLISDLDKLGKKKSKPKKKPRSGWHAAFNEHMETRLDEIIESETAKLESERTPSYRYSKEAENEAAAKLSSEDNKKLTAIRRRKNRFVSERNYEQAAKARDEERELLGLNG